MKTFSNHINKFRIRKGALASTDNDGLVGAFDILLPCGLNAFVISTDGIGVSPIWEHVSVSTATRCLTWEEMCFIKALFWNDDETVVQYHPAKDVYVKRHPYCLHLWRPVGQELPVPPPILVG